MSKSAFEKEITKTGAIDALGRTLFRVVTSTADKVTAAPCDTVWSADSEPIFPPFLKTHPTPSSLAIIGSAVSWYRPTSLTELLELKSRFPAGRLIGGNSEVGIEMKFKDAKVPVLISMTHVPELRALSVARPRSVAAAALATALGLHTTAGVDLDVLEVNTGSVDCKTVSRDEILGALSTSGGVIVGGAVTLSQLRDSFDELLHDDSLPSYCTRPCAAAYNILRWFASTQIRNVATLAGNVATASPISDMNPLLVAMQAVACVASPSTGNRRLISFTKMFKSYRKTEIGPDEVIVSMFLPFCSEFEFVCAYKQARRREDDITLVGAAFRAQLAPVDAGNGWKVVSAGAAFAGMSPITVQAPSMIRALVGGMWTESTIQTACEALHADLPLPPAVPGGKSAILLSTP